MTDADARLSEIREQLPARVVGCPGRFIYAGSPRCQQCGYGKDKHRLAFLLDRVIQQEQRISELTKGLAEAMKEINHR